MRGIFYTGIIILISLMIFSIVAVQKENTSSERESKSIRQEIFDMDSSYQSILRSTHTICDVSLRRAIISSQSSIINEDPSFFANGAKAPAVIKQLMWNGSLPDQAYSSGFMENNTLEQNLNDLEDFYAGDSRGYNVSIGLNYSNATIGMADAFSVFFNGTFQINISKVGLANMSRTYQVYELVHLQGFEDPVFLINLTGGKISRVINKSRYIGNFTQIIPLNVLSGSGYCYGGLTNDASSTQKSKLIYYNGTVYPSADSFCGVIYISGSSPNTSYLRVTSLAGLDVLAGQKLLLLGNGETWGISDGLFNVDNLLEHIRSGSYVNSSTGPSFFDGLEGNIDCNYCSTYGPVGLETIIDKNQLSSPELHIIINASASNTLHEYLGAEQGSRFGFNESSIDSGFYEFRLGDSMRNYFQ